MAAEHGIIAYIVAYKPRTKRAEPDSTDTAQWKPGVNARRLRVDRGL